MSCLRGLCAWALVPLHLLSTPLLATAAAAIADDAAAY